MVDDCEKKNAFSCGDIFIAAQRTTQIARKHESQFYFVSAHDFLSRTFCSVPFSCVVLRHPAEI